MSDISRMGEPVQYHAALLELLPDPVWVADVSGKITFCNRAARSCLGCDLGQAGWKERIHPEDSGGMENWFPPGSTEGTACATLRLRDGSGHYRWFKLTGSLLPGLERDGEADIAQLWVAHDIDGEKVYELALQKRLRNQVAMLDASIDCIKVISPDGRLVDMNRSGCLALGVSPASGFGMDWLGLLPSDVHIRGEAALTAAQDGEIGRFPGRSELPGTAPRHWDNVLTPVVNGEGKVTAILCLSRDITVERELEERLRLSNLDLEAKVQARTAELATLWNTSQDLLLVVDRDGEIVRANPAWLDILGYEAARVAGHQVDVFAAVEHRGLVRDAFAPKPSRSPGPVEIPHLHKDGSVRWIEWIVVSSGHEIYATGRDMTASREAEERLRHAEDALHHSQKVEAIGRLTGCVAHDFNNLLAVIRNSVTLMQRPGIGEKQRAHCLDMLDSTTDRAISVTRQLLDFARRSPYSPAVFSVGRRIIALRDMLAVICGTGIEIVVQADTQPFFALADPAQFDTALVNLTTNARDAMGAIGTLKIGIRIVSAARSTWRRHTLHGAFVAVSVADTGGGIPEEMIDQVFEPFFSTKSPGVGTGLGLSQVVGFAEQAGGTVELGRATGGGAVFTIYLPATRESLKQET